MSGYEANFAQGAIAALDKADEAANRDSWRGDREPYLRRMIAVAQVYATLAVAEAITEGRRVP